jgi:xylulokinase
MTLKWFKDNFYNLEEKTSRGDLNIYDLMTREAVKTRAGSDGLIMLPHLLGAFIPENNPKAKGVFFGIGIDHKKSHFTRAILESVGFMLKRDLELFDKMGHKIKEITSLGGGAQSDIWNQIKADITGIEINTFSYTEKAVLGAALIAGVGAGIYSNFEEVVKQLSKDKKTYYPNPENEEIYENSFKKYKELYLKLENLF